MNSFNYIHHQVVGFLRAGKKIQLPRNKDELFVSRFIALLLLCLLVFSYSSLLRWRDIPWWIYLRALIYIGPGIALIIRLYRGISPGWIIRGLRKFWLLPACLIFIYFMLAHILFYILTGIKMNLNHISLYSGLICFLVGFIIFIALNVEASLTGRNYKLEKIPWTLLSSSAKMKMIFYRLVSLFFIPFLLAGLLFIAQGLGIIYLGS
ncbi:MAG: hypothetical protein JXB60_07340 [Candidatus Cloacimonetes bacterium]|nr:hypothetical protein [Candidatus Cloacimonadota bacterium]